MTRNELLDLARGDLVAFIDADDYVYPTYLERLYQALYNEKADMGMCGVQKFSGEFPTEIHKDDKQTIRLISGREAYLELYGPDRERFTVSWGKLWRKECFAGLRYREDKICEDLFLSHRLYEQTKRVAVLDTPLYAYYRNYNGIMRSPYSIRRYDEVRAYEDGVAFFSQRKDEALMRLAARERELCIAYHYFRACKAGLKKQIPLPYRISRREAFKRLRVNLTDDQYEYFLIDYYPNYIKLRAYFRHILRKRKPD